MTQDGVAISGFVYAVKINKQKPKMAEKIRLHVWGGGRKFDYYSSLSCPIFSSHLQLIPPKIHASSQQNTFHCYNLSSSFIQQLAAEVPHINLKLRHYRRYGRISAMLLQDKTSFGFLGKQVSAFHLVVIIVFTDVRQCGRKFVLFLVFKLLLLSANTQQYFNTLRTCLLLKENQLL